MGFIADLFGATNNYKVNEGLQGSGTQMSNYSNAIQNMLGSTGADPLQAQQADFIKMLQGQMGGGAPSVAQNQLAMATDQAQKQVAGQVANIRGLNPATAARLALQNQAGQAQQMAGQAATLRAQEQQANQGQLGQALAQGRDQNTGRLSALGQLQGQQNAQAIQNKLGAAQINAGVAGQNASTNAGIGGGILGGLASAIGLARGGSVPPVQYLDDGGVVLPGNLMGAATQYAKDTGFAQALMNAGTKINDRRVARDNAENDAIMASLPQGGPAPQVVPQAALNAFAGAPGLFAGSGAVPGRAEVAGDSYRNDKVPAMLSPGEIVIPRTKTDPDDAKEFVKAVKAQGKGMKANQKEMSYGEVLRAHKQLQDRVAQLESFACGGRVGYADGGAVKSPVSKDEADKFNASLQNAFGYGTYLNTRKKKA